MLVVSTHLDADVIVAHIGDLELVLDVSWRLWKLQLVDQACVVPMLHNAVHT